MTLTDAAAAMRPPIPRRELARRLKGTPPAGREYGRSKRPAALFPVGEILKAHAAWVREKGCGSGRDQG